MLYEGLKRLLLEKGVSFTDEEMSEIVKESLGIIKKVDFFDNELIDLFHEKGSKVSMIRYERVYNLGNYQNEKITITKNVLNGSIVRELEKLKEQAYDSSQSKKNDIELKYKAAVRFFKGEYMMDHEFFNNLPKERIEMEAGKIIFNYEDGLCSWQAAVEKYKKKSSPKKDDEEDLVF